MQIEVDPAEFKNAVTAISQLIKKMPAEIGRNDASVAIAYFLDGFHVVATFDWFTASIPVPSMKIIGDSKELTSWTGGNLTMNSMIGIVNENLLQSILTKIKEKELLTIEYEKGKPFMTIKTTKNAQYIFDTADAKKVMGSFTISKNKEFLCKIDQSELDNLGESITALSQIVVPSVSKPSFGCICLSSEKKEENSNDMFMRMSGNSESEGFSVIYDTIFVPDREFTALIPKVLGEGLKGFLGSLKVKNGCSLECNINDDGKTTEFFFTADEFELGLSCMTDDFPFKAVGGILKSVQDPFCEFTIKNKNFKDSVGRVSALAVLNDSLNTLQLYDEGGFKIKQHNGFNPSSSVAEESISDSDIIRFPDSTSEVQTVIKTDIMKKMLKFFGNSDFNIGITEASRGLNGKLVFSVIEPSGESLTGVQLGVRV